MDKNKLSKYRFLLLSVIVIKEKAAQWPPF